MDRTKKTRTYQVHGAFIESNVDFQEFEPVGQCRPDIVLSVRSPSTSEAGLPGEGHPVLTGIYNLPHGGTETFELLDCGNHYFARWRLLGDFKVSKDGSWIACHPWAGVSWSDIRPFLLGRVIPLALNLRNVLTLHGGAVLMPHGAVALIANSGMGKSTLLSTLACLGFPLVSDDVIAVRASESECYAEYGARHVRLTKASLEHLRPKLPLTASTEDDYDKTRVYLRKYGTSTGALPLKAIYLLDRELEDENEHIRIWTPPTRDTFPILIKNLTNISLLAIPQIKQQLAILSGIMNNVPVKVLQYKSGLDLLPEVCTALVDDHNAPAAGASQVLVERDRA